MTMTTFSLSLLLFLSHGMTLAAQHRDHDPARHRQPYAGLEKHPVKALSAQEMDDLQTGKGMGMALAAELNGYPGPRHVLDLDEALGLTERQRQTISALFGSMSREAIRAGAKVIEEEQRLEVLFSSGKAEETALEPILRRIGEARAELRRTHLVYHLRTKATLTPQQVAQYNRLRGYAGDH